MNRNRCIGIDLDSPPPTPVTWHGVDSHDSTRTCEVIARTWFAARLAAMTMLGTDDVRVTQEVKPCKT